MRKLLILVTSILAFTACQKELSFEGGTITTLPGSASGTAVYRLSGAGSTCTGFVLSGIYQAGTAMVASDSVVLQVTVDTIGTYSLTTNNINGIVFTGSGTFTKTGIQTITLIATGTPTTAGSFIYTPPVGTGCNFTVMVASGTTTTSSYTWQFTYNNKTFSGPIIASKDSILATGGELLALYGIGITTTNGLKDSTAFGLSLVNLFGKVTPAVYPTNINLANLGTSVTKLCLQWAYGFAYEGNNSGNYDSVYLALPTVANMNVVVTNYSTSSNIIQGTFNGTANNGSSTKDSLVVITNGTFTSKITY